LKLLAFLEEKEVIAVLVLSLIYNISFALRSGPSGWLSEKFPPETKMEGMVLSNTLTIGEFISAIYCDIQNLTIVLCVLDFGCGLTLLASICLCISGLLDYCIH
jgi:hypothetical protein